MFKRSLENQRRRERILQQPEPEDERLTRPSVVSAMQTQPHTVLADPNREERLALSRARMEAKQAEKDAERRDHLQTLYMNARTFITTEEQLAACSPKARTRPGATTTSTARISGTWACHRLFNPLSTKLGRARRPAGMLLKTGSRGWANRLLEASCDFDWHPRTSCTIFFEPLRLIFAHLFLHWKGRHKYKPLMSCTLYQSCRGYPLFSI